MRKIWLLIAGLLIPVVSAGVATIAIPVEDVDAAAYDCVRWKEPWKDGHDWAYLWCPSGKSYYYAVFTCVHWIGHVRLVEFPETNIAHAGVDVSAGWCSDGFHVSRMRIKKVVWPL